MADAAAAAAVVVTAADMNAIKDKIHASAAAKPTTKQCLDSADSLESLEGDVDIPRQWMIDNAPMVAEALHYADANEKSLGPAAVLCSMAKRVLQKKGLSTRDMVAELYPGPPLTKEEKKLRHSWDLARERTYRYLNALVVGEAGSFSNAQMLTTPKTIGAVNFAPTARAKSIVDHFKELDRGKEIKAHGLWEFHAGLIINGDTFVSSTKEQQTKTKKAIKAACNPHCSEREKTSKLEAYIKQIQSAEWGARILGPGILYCIKLVGGGGANIYHKMTFDDRHRVLHWVNQLRVKSPQGAWWVAHNREAAAVLMSAARAADVEDQNPMTYEFRDNEQSPAQHDKAVALLGDLPNVYFKNEIGFLPRLKDIEFPPYDAKPPAPAQDAGAEEVD